MSEFNTRRDSSSKILVIGGSNISGSDIIIKCLQRDDSSVYIKPEVEKNNYPKPKIKKNRKNR